MTTADRIEAILRAVPDTRNSDLELWLIYARKSGLELTREQEAIIRDMPSFETIVRVRRKLQEQGKYPASANIKAMRHAKASNTRANIVKAEPDQIVKLTDGLVDIGGGKVILPFGE